MRHQIKAARAARRRRLPKRDEAAASDFRKLVTGLGVLGGVVGGLSYAGYEIREHPKGKLGELYYGSIVEDIVKVMYKYTFGNFDHIFDPSSDELIPTWPTAPYYAEAGIPPGTPAPPLLVLDLEKTLVGSEYDSVNGWRHVKRPGLDKFLKSLQQYYEIAIFSENDLGMAMDIMAAIDPEGEAEKSPLSILYPFMFYVCMLVIVYTLLCFYVLPCPLPPSY